MVYHLEEIIPISTIVFNIEGTLIHVNSRTSRGRCKHSQLGLKLSTKVRRKGGTNQQRNIQINPPLLRLREKTNLGLVSHEVVTLFAPRLGGLLAVLRHFWRQQWREEDEDAVCCGTSSQVSNLVSEKSGESLHASLTHRLATL